MRGLPQPPTKLPGGKIPGKVAAVLNIYHSLPGVPTRGLTPRWSRWLHTTEPMFAQEIEVPPSTWTKVDYGPLAANEMGVSVIVLENVEGLDLVRVPSLNQRQSILSRILEVCLTSTPNVKEPQQLVLPGEGLPLYPTQNTHLYLRCLSPGETVRVRITIIPG